MNDRTTMTISGARKMRLERLAIDASKEADRTILWTQIVNYMIDEYSKEAAEDLKKRIKNEQKREK